MQLLLDDAFAPIASDIGFLEAPADVVARGFLEWQRNLPHDPPTRFYSRRIRGSLGTIIRSLEPLTSGDIRRFLFIPTNSAWTAYLNNAHSGTDTGWVSYLARRLRCRGLRIFAVPHTIRKESDRWVGRYGGLCLELYGPVSVKWSTSIRAIGVMNDGGSWAWISHGEPLPFENTVQYSARRLRDRLTFDDLRHYAQALGVEPFEEAFYAPERDAIRIEKRQALYPGMREFTLAEARATF